jgi:hypothetical protein
VLSLGKVLISFLSLSTVHSIAAWKLLIKTSPDAEERVVDEIEEVRRIIYELQRPALEPKYIFAPPYQQDDLVIFYNRGLMHCASGKRIPCLSREELLAESCAEAESFILQRRD